MAEPACKDCKHFYQPPLTSKGGECMDPTKRIFPRRTATSEVDPPWIHDEENYTCRNWTDKNAPVVINPCVRPIQLRSLNVEVIQGWHEIHDGSTGESAVQLRLDWMRAVLFSRGKRGVAGTGLYARGPFEVVELYGNPKEDGTVGYVSVSLPDKNDKEGYTFANEGDWVVRLPTGEIVVRKDWKPTGSRTKLDDFDIPEAAKKSLCAFFRERYGVDLR